VTFIYEEIGHAMSPGIYAGICKSTHGKPVKKPGSGRIWTCGSKSRSDLGQPSEKFDKGLADF